ncbi:MAG: hypothetical protein IK088_04075, partial [Lachnospiraceae bacterium]|nr:hypothetical protein [Lachnospiraceae bacterium]
GSGTESADETGTEPSETPEKTADEGSEPAPSDPIDTDETAKKPWSAGEIIAAVLIGILVLVWAGGLYLFLRRRR